MSRTSRVILCAYGACILTAGGLYAISCAPGSLWQDSGLIQYRLWHGDIRGVLGLALSHPLFYLIARGAGAVGLGEFGYRVNMVSALAGAVTVANIGLLAGLYSGRILPALIAAVTLALSHTFWWHCSVAETYTLWAAFFSAELLALLQYERTRRPGYLYLLGLLNGAALAVHMLASIPSVCYGVLVIGLLVKKRLRPLDVVVMALLWLAGALPYGYLIAERLVQTRDVLGTLQSVLFGERWRADVLNTGLSWGLLGDNVRLLVLNCPSPNALLFFFGLGALWKMKEQRLLGGMLLALMALFLAFAFRYTVADRYAFFIPFYIIASIAVGLGAGFFRERLCRSWVVVVIACGALLPAGVYAVLPDVARQMRLPIGTRADVAYRDDYAYFLQPWKTGYRGADRYADEALELAGPRAVIYADTTTVGPLLYAQEVRGRRTDVKIVTGIAASEGAPAYNAESVERSIGQCPVYVTSNRAGYCPDFILKGPYDLAPTGVLWRVFAISTPAK